MANKVSRKEDHDVSIIIPVYNAAKWLSSCLESIIQQTFNGRLELSVYNDGSTDDSEGVIKSFEEKLKEKNIPLVYSCHKGLPRGVGYAKNQAIKASGGTYLCFLDADDVMMKDRISLQYEAATLNKDAIIGCKIHRFPENSTVRYTDWANNLTAEQLYTQTFTSHGPTVIMPTWFCHRSVIEKAGGFSENGKGTPEDLICFYNHLESGGKVVRVDEDLLMYRYHPSSETFSVKEETIWRLRVEFLQRRVIDNWTHFTIWNAGKQGRHLYRSLNQENRDKVLAFCDVDPKKIAKGFYTFEDSPTKPKPKIPILHFSQAKPPIIISLKQNFGGNFEENLSSLDLVEGVDFYHFN